MKLLRVRMNQLQTEWNEVPSAYEHLGGRALIAKILLEEITPACDALGPHNKFILAPGLLAGSGVTTSGRLSVGGKSPLTNGVKEANAGGTAGDNLARMGVKAVVVEGQPARGTFHILYIGNEKIELLPADEFLGLGTYATSDKLKEKFGEDCTVLSIGQAGEFLMRGAGVCSTGDPGQRSNHAARGGLGAVMGSKGLKAVVVEKAKSRSISFADVDLFRSASKRFAKEIVDSPKLGPKGGTHMYGTAAIMGAVNEMGSLPTRNFSSGSFEGSENLRGEKIRETILAREGKIGTRCMPGCVIGCRHQYVDEMGMPIIGTMQYETIALVGSNLGIGDLDDIARLNYICNDFGLDTIETGAALGVVLEAGLGEFGDTAGIMGLLKHVGEGTPLGHVIGNGVVTAGQVFGIRRVPAVLGQAMPGYDPRSLKGNGVTYATSPQGADHTAGNAFGARNQVNPLGIEGQKELSLNLQIISAMLDTTGLCLFARPPVISDPQMMADMINGIYGWGWSVNDLDAMYRNDLRDELEFNRLAGKTAKDYRIPEYMREEPLAPHNVVFDVPDSELDSVFDTL